jgi:hypothetical protein
MCKTRTTVALCLMFAFAAALTAGPIDIRTGVDGALNPLNAGDLDPFWEISTDGTNFSAAVVAFPAQICCGMESAPATATWITDPSVSADSPFTGWGFDNPVTIRRSFNLSGYDLSTVALSGLWRVADNSLGIYINGNLIPDTVFSSTWGNDFAVNLAAGSGFFQNGTNVISMVGTSGNSAWDAFFLDVTVNGRLEGDGGGSTVPEPATVALLGGGLLALALVYRRRKHS